MLIQYETQPQLLRPQPPLNIAERRSGTDPRPPRPLNPIIGFFIRGFGKDKAEPSKSPQGGSPLKELGVNRVVAALYREWNAVEKLIAVRETEKRRARYPQTESVEPVEIIDSDVSGLPQETLWGFDNRDQVRRAIEVTLELIQDEISSVVADSHHPQAQLRMLRDSLKASSWYAAALEKPPDPRQFTRETMGLNLKVLGEDAVIGKQAEKVQRWLEVSGCWDGFLATSFASYRLNQQVSAEEVKAEMMALLPEALARFIDFTGLPDFSDRFRSADELIELVRKEDAWWRMNAFTRDGKPHNQLNEGQTFLRGSAESYLWHEDLRHIYDQLMLEHNIKAGLILPARGITAEHFPRGFASEGLAQRLPDFLPRRVTQLSPWGWLHTQMRIYEQYIYNNGYLRAYRLDDPETHFEEAIQYCVDHGLDEQESRTVLKNRLNDPLGPYAGIYGRAAHLYGEGCKRLGDYRRRRGYLLRDYGFSPTPEYALVELKLAKLDLLKP